MSTRSQEVKELRSLYIHIQIFLCSFSQDFVAFLFVCFCFILGWVFWWVGFLLCFVVFCFVFCFCFFLRGAYSPIKYEKFLNSCVSLFNDISTFVEYSMPIPRFKKNTDDHGGVLVV